LRPRQRKQRSARDIERQPELGLLRVDVAVLSTRGCSRCDVLPNRVEAFDERAACQREALTMRLSVLRKSCSVIQEGEEVSRVEATVLRRQ